MSKPEYFHQYLQGRWPATLATSAFNRAYTAQCPSAWIHYLDICHSIQGITLEQWLNISQHSQKLSRYSPQLCLKLMALMHNEELFSTLGKSCRLEHCSHLKESSQNPFFELIADIRASGYLGCRLTHYPGLLATNKNTGGVWQRSNRLNSMCRAQALASRKILFSDYIIRACEQFPHKKQGAAHARIAVVGNSPDVLREEKGDEIDSADIVIRFNNSAVGRNKEAFCGARTDIWVMSPSSPIALCPSDAKLVVVSGLHALTRPSFYWKKLLHGDKRLAELSMSVWHELVTQFQAPPSAGALLLASLEALPVKADVRTYGFTTRHEDVRAMRNHHADEKPRSSRHNWQAETKWLADRFA